MSQHDLKEGERFIEGSGNGSFVACCFYTDNYVREAEALRTDEMRAKLAVQGWQAVGSSPEGLANRIHADVKALGSIIRDQHIQTQ